MTRSRPRPLSNQQAPVRRRRRSGAAVRCRKACSRPKDRNPVHANPAGPGKAAWVRRIAVSTLRRLPVRRSAWVIILAESVSGLPGGAASPSPFQRRIRAGTRSRAPRAHGPPDSRTDRVKCRCSHDLSNPSPERDTVLEIRRQRLGEERQEASRRDVRREQDQDPQLSRAHPPAHRHVHRAPRQRVRPRRRHLRADQGGDRQRRRRAHHGVRQEDRDRDRERGWRRSGAGARLRPRHPPRQGRRVRIGHQHRRQVQRRRLPVQRRTERGRHQGRQRPFEVVPRRQLPRREVRRGEIRARHPGRPHPDREGPGGAGRHPGRVHPGR